MAVALTDMQLTSPAFEDGQAIPTRHTGQGDNVSPAFAWSGPPQGAHSFAIFCHDADATVIAENGTYGFVHWVAYNIPSSASGLEEGSREYTAGINDYGEAGYRGPNPPEGHGVHRYLFWLLALDSQPDLPPGLNLWDLLARAEPHVLGMNRVMGTFQR